MQAGGVVAYPTESVFGLGCDPWCETAAQRILTLKGRPAEMGLILIGSSVEHFARVSAIAPAELTPKLTEKGSRPTSWAIPAAADLPAWITGGRDTVVVRLVQHPVAEALCRGIDGPIVSTSANRTGVAPARTADEVRCAFSEGLDVLVDAPTGGVSAPSIIRDWRTGEWLRQ